MDTRLLSAGREEDIRLAAELLRHGQLVAFPTETVYGLGARSDSKSAMAALRRAKRRPPGKPFTILIPDPEDASAYAAPLCAAAQALGRRFWPGPLTLVVPARGGGWVGLRCPDHDVTRRLLRRAGCPVAAPSANRSGDEPARAAREALEAFEGVIAAVLDGGTVPGGQASTVVRVSSDEAHLLREGPVTGARIAAEIQASTDGEPREKCG
jgi:L-threonylcarbamoyladenylate synthase